MNINNNRVRDSDYFSKFQIIQTDINSSQNDRLCLGNILIYGKLKFRFMKIEEELIEKELLTIENKNILSNTELSLKMSCKELRGSFLYQYIIICFMLITE